MPRYFFDIHDVAGFHPDEFGDEFDNFDTVKVKARDILSDFIRQEMPNSGLHRLVCEVSDDTGVLIYRGEIIYQETQLRRVRTGKNAR